MYSKPGINVQQQTLAQRYGVLVQRDTLLQAFRLFVAGLVIWSSLNIKTSNLESILGAILIGITALVPSYLWCTRKALGIPIFPLFALTFLWTYAVQLLSDNPVITAYPASSHLSASVTIASGLGAGTLIWFRCVSQPPPSPISYRAFGRQQGERFFLWSLAASAFFTMAIFGGWLSLDGGTFALIRAAMLAVNALGVFILAYDLGARKLSQTSTRLFWVLLVAYILTNSASLLLVGAMSAFMLATVGFILGSRTIPWKVVIIAILFFSFLHLGKGEMRGKYWFSANHSHFVQPWEYPAWYSEWASYSAAYIAKPTVEVKEEKQSPLERSSLMGLLLMAQEKTPTTVPYLSGTTYAIIPQLLIPRFLSPTKISSHEGTYLLNIHYGRQTRKDTATTTIGWGLMNEAYANFGYLGCVGLGGILGLLYGKAAQWSIHTPPLSARFLFCVVLMSYAFQSEFSAGVYVAALYQSTMVLIGISFLMMQEVRIGSQPKL